MKRTIILIISLIFTITGCSKEPPSPVSQISQQETSQSQDAKDDIQISIEPEWAGIMGLNFENYWIEVDGKRLTLMMSYKDTQELGISMERADGTENQIIESGDAKQYNLIDEFSIFFENLTSESKSIEELPLTQMSFYPEAVKNYNFSIMGKATTNSTLEDIYSEFGEPYLKEDKENEVWLWYYDEIDNDVIYLFFGLLDGKLNETHIYIGE